MPVERRHQDDCRRFVFLALTTGHAVTPSEDVDQVWHLHLAYTRDYWERFSAATSIRWVRAVESLIGRELEKRLVDRGLLTGSWWDSSSPWIIFAPVLATLGLSIAKMAVGISRGRPVGFLMLGCGGCGGCGGGD